MLKYYLINISDLKENEHVFRKNLAQTKAIIKSQTAPVYEQKFDTRDQAIIYINNNISSWEEIIR